MGDPRKLRKTYEGPSHPWQKERIDREKVLMREYGLKNKKELWKMQSTMKHMADQAKRLTGLTGTQAQLEKTQLINRLVRLGLLSAGAEISDILDLTVESILNRRLQTILFKNGLTRTTKQARQCITHRHVMVKEKIVTAPSYVVPVSEEETITFAARSPFVSLDHPERIVEKPAVVEEETEEKHEEKKKPKTRKPVKREKKEEKKPEVKKEETEKKEEKKPEVKEEKQEEPKEEKKE